MAKDTNSPLRTAYFNAIKNLSFQGENLKVYDDLLSDKVVVSMDEFIYVVIKDQTDNDALRQKNGMVHDSTILINIFHGVRGGAGKSKVDEVSGLILNNLNPMNSSGFLNLSSSSLQIVTTSKISDVTNTFTTNSHKVWVRSMRFRHLISEL